MWSGNRHSPKGLLKVWPFPSICSLGHVKPRFQGILLYASQLTEQLYPWGPGCSAFSFGNAHCPRVPSCHPEGLVRLKVSWDIPAKMWKGWFLRVMRPFFFLSQTTEPPWTSHFPSFPRKSTKAKVQVAKGQVPLTFYSHLLLVQGKEGVMGLTSQGVPGEPVLELELHLGPVLGQGQQQQWEQKGPSLGCQDQADCEGFYFSEPAALLAFPGWPFIRPAWTHKLFREVQRWRTWRGRGWWRFKKGTQRGRTGFLGVKSLPVE